MKHRVIKSYQSLWIGEAFSAVAFTILWNGPLPAVMHHFDETHWIPAHTAFAVLIFILIQGTVYWWLKWSQAKRGDFSTLPDRTLRVFSALKRLNPVLLGVSLGTIMIWPPQLWDSAGLFVFLWLFAAGEHINYYILRLSYQSRNDFRLARSGHIKRRAKLAVELDRRNEMK